MKKDYEISKIEAAQELARESSESERMGCIPAAAALFGADWLNIVGRASPAALEILPGRRAPYLMCDLFPATRRSRRPCNSPAFTI